MKIFINIRYEKYKVLKKLEALNKKIFNISQNNNSNSKDFQSSYKSHIQCDK